MGWKYGLGLQNSYVHELYSKSMSVVAFGYGNVEPILIILSNIYHQAFVADI